MNQNRGSFVRRVLKDQNGQVLPVVALLMAGILGMGGLVVDAGQLFYSSNELQASANAAALAGAQNLPNLTASTIATTYSSAAGNLNAHSNLPNVATVVTLKCLTTLTAESMPCVAPANANAIRVQQQVAIRTYFAGTFGMPSVTLTSTATAAMRGGATPPYNVAIIVDTSSSMSDSDSNCNSTRIKCALAGVQTLLQELSPCGSSQSNCGTADSTGNVANLVDAVSLFAFPNVTQSTVANDYNCKNPTSAPYTFPTAGASTYAPGSSTATYQIVPYSSDYRASDTITSLNTSSNLTKAAGGKSGCQGMAAIGGQGTYYAGAIYAAQASLVAEQGANPGSQNVIILLGDGDVSTTKTTEMPGASTSSLTTYPSMKQECQQAVTAAQTAATAGTRVYSIAYGAASSGCSTDTSPKISPCLTMQQIASSPTTFFSDYTSGGNCLSAARPTTNLNQIFTEVGGDFTTPRLISNDLP